MNAIRKERIPVTHQEGAVLTGKVKYFKKSYGFITPDDSTLDDVFVHHTAIEPWRQGFKELKEGDVVQFKLVRGKDNKWQANDVEVYREPVESRNFRVTQPNREREHRG